MTNGTVIIAVLQHLFQACWVWFLSGKPHYLSLRETSIAWLSSSVRVPLLPKPAS